MGLTYLSTWKNARGKDFSGGYYENDPVIAIAGNPNTGKSTVFNVLTGLRQHTGNWPGKTILHAEGNFTHQGQKFSVIDLPGTYSLLPNSDEEKLARDFICFERPDAIVTVVDATCIERNLNLVLQIMEICPRVIVCVNLIDEARRKKINIDIERMSEVLGVPVVATAARNRYGIARLKDLIYDIAKGKIKPEPRLLRYSSDIEEMLLLIQPEVENFFGDTVNSRWLSLRLLERDKSLLESFKGYFNSEQFKFIQGVMTT